jgi:hypothetical protein
MTARASHRLLMTLGALLVLAGLAVIYFRDPSQPGNYPSCLFFALTGLHCPGCGTTRGLHLLLHGDIAGAMAMNVIMVVSIPCLAWYGVSHLLVSRGRAPLPGCRLAGKSTFVLAAVFILYAVLRNLPFEPFASLAPG